MVIKLTNNYTTFELEKGESNECLQRIGKSLKYNPFLTTLRRKNPELFQDEDWNYPDFISGIAKKIHSEKYQNYLSYLYNDAIGADSLYYNPFIRWRDENGEMNWGKPFLPHEMWDGETRYFPVRANSRKLKTWSGWFRRIYKFLVKNYPDMPLYVQDKRTEEVKFKKEFVSDFGRYKLREYQVDIAKKVISTLTDTENLGHYFNAVCLDLATNTGKTPVIGALINNFTDNTSIIIPVDRQDLFLKMIEDLAIDIGVDSLGLIISDQMKTKVNKLCKNISGLKEKLSYNSFERITLVMMPTFISRIKRGEYTADTLNGYDVGIFDECHLAVSPSYLDFIKYGNFRLRIGLSGTPYDHYDRHRNYEVLGLFGESRYTISNAENMDRGVSLVPYVKMWEVEGGCYPVKIGSEYIGDDDEYSEKEKCRYYNGARYSKLFDAITWLKNKQTLVYFGYADIKYGKAVEKYLRYRFPDLTIAYTDGEDPDTWDKVDKFKKNEINILIVNRIFMMGVNIPNIQHFVNWESTDNKVSVKQAVIGRSIRTNDEDDRVYISDFYDNYGIAQTYSEIRKSIYMDESNGCHLIQNA